MEALLVIGALVAGANYLNQDEPVVETASVEQSVPSGGFLTNEGLDNLDWSKAGNFTVVSTNAQVKWVMITGN